VVSATVLEQAVFDFRRAIEREDGAVRGGKVTVPARSKEKRGSEAFGVDTTLTNNTLQLGAKLRK